MGMHSYSTLSFPLGLAAEEENQEGGARGDGDGDGDSDGDGDDLTSSRVHEDAPILEGPVDIGHH